MGQAKKYYELMELEVENLPDDKYTCAEHFEDYAVRAFINNFDVYGRCTYCLNRKPIALTKDVIYFIKEGIFSFYGHPDDEGVGYDSSEGGYMGAKIFDTEDMFEDADLSIEDDKLYKDVYAKFGLNHWCERDPYADRENVELNFKWENFKKAVKGDTVYIFQSMQQPQPDFSISLAGEILNEIALRIDSLNLFQWLEPEADLYRCRQHPTWEVLNTAEQLASPPDDRAKLPNRMSPAGVSMFYCAFDKLTCHMETVDYSDTSREFVTTGTFRNIKRLYLLDLTNLPDLPSKFDANKRKHFYSILFLKQFVDDLSRPINRDGHQHIEYIPTQIISDYFRYTYEIYTGACIDGILYPSSKTGTTNACVLFYDHHKSLESLQFDASRLITENIYKGL